MFAKSTWRTIGLLALTCAQSSIAQDGRPVTAASQVDAGKQLFTSRCAVCHNPSGPGTLALTRRLGSERSLLDQRTDLQADYIRAVVRAGQLTMPPISRVEVTDDELNGIIEYLQRATPESRQAEQ